MHDAFHVPCGYGESRSRWSSRSRAADVDSRLAQPWPRSQGCARPVSWTGGVVALGALFGLALAAVAGPKASASSTRAG